MRVLLVLAFLLVTGCLALIGQQIRHKKYYYTSENMFILVLADILRAVGIKNTIGSDRHGRN